MLVSWGCCRKLPQTGWLKMAEIYSLTVLEDTRVEIKVSAGQIPSKVSREASFLPSCSSRGSSPRLAAGHPISASIFKRTSRGLLLVVGFRAHSGIQNDVMSRALTMSLKPLLPNKFTFTGFGGHVFWGATIQTTLSCPLMYLTLGPPVIPGYSWQHCISIVE